LQWTCLARRDVVESLIFLFMTPRSIEQSSVLSTKRGETQDAEQPFPLDPQATKLTFTQRYPTVAAPPSRTKDRRSPWPRGCELGSSILKKKKKINERLMCTSYLSLWQYNSGRSEVCCYCCCCVSMIPVDCLAFLILTWKRLGAWSDEKYIGACFAQ